MHLDFACLFEPFPQSVDVSYHYAGGFLLFGPLLLLGWLSVVISPLWLLFLQLRLLCRMLRAHGGQSQVSRDFMMCSISLCSAC